RPPRKTLCVRTFNGQTEGIVRPGPRIPLAGRVIQLINDEGRPVILNNPHDPMPALGQKQTSGHVRAMSALPPKADIGTLSRNVRFVPKADIPQYQTFKWLEKNCTKIAGQSQ